MHTTIRWQVAAIAIAWASTASADAPGAVPPPEIPLYKGVAPGSEKWDWEEKSVTTRNGLPTGTAAGRPLRVRLFSRPLFV